MQEINLNFDNYEIAILLVEDKEGVLGGQIITNLKEDGSLYYNLIIDGIESLLLAMACNKVDISSPAMISSLKTALETCANNS